MNGWEWVGRGEGGGVAIDESFANIQKFFALNWIASERNFIFIKKKFFFTYESQRLKDWGVRLFWCLKKIIVVIVSRHLYIPIVEMGYGKTVASGTVFFISAFFHEYLVSVPLKTFKVWAFLGMMGQVSEPLRSLAFRLNRHSFFLMKFSPEL